MAKKIRKINSKYYYIDDSKFNLVYTFSVNFKLYEVELPYNFATGTTTTTYILYDTTYDNVFTNKISLFNFLIEYSSINNINILNYITFLLSYFPDQIKEIT